jgi:hypothetical protein
MPGINGHSLNLDMSAFAALKGSIFKAIGLCATLVLIIRI